MTITASQKSNLICAFVFKIIKLSLVAAFAGALLSLLIATPVKADTNLLTNPGFETGNYSGWSRVGPFTGITSGHNSTFGAYVGAGLGDNGTVGDLLSQTIPTTVGLTYDVSIWVAGNSGGSGDNYILWDGSRIFDSVNPNYSDWTKLEATVTATSSSSTVSFGSYSGNSYVFDDAVVAEPAPEPSALAIGLVGIVGFALFRMRK